MASESVTSTRKFGLPVGQEPKYTTNGYEIVNRSTLVPIPADEPIFIFRASDYKAHRALAFYMSLCCDEDHYRAVSQRTVDFEQFMKDHPERMKEPTTDGFKPAVNLSLLGNGGRFVNVGKDFTRYPAGRMMSDSPYGGESFRRLFLHPALDQRKLVTIALDTALGYGSSFLDEAFGGLIRSGYTKSDIEKYIRLETTDLSLKLEIETYIDAAVTSLPSGS